MRLKLAAPVVCGNIAFVQCTVWRRSFCEAAHPVKPGGCVAELFRCLSVPLAPRFEVPLSLLFALSGDEHLLVGASKDPMGRRRQT